jgi:NDP-sugar pyrophosphorylase family protein
MQGFIVMDETVVILCGGMATRLRPITEKIPKALIEINGIPFIKHQLDFLSSKNVKNIALLLGNKGEMVQAYLESLDLKFSQIKYCYDGEKLLGTGGAILKSLDIFTENFFVMYGDSYLNVNFSNVMNFFLAHPNYNSLMTVFKNDNLFDKSNVIFEQGELLSYSKKIIDSRMNYIDWGLSVFNKDAFSSFSNLEEFDLSVVFDESLRARKLIGHEIFERFYEIGSFSGISELEKYLTKT